MNGLKIFIKPAKQIKFGFNFLRFFCNSFSNFFLLSLLLIIIFLNFPFNFKPDAVELFEIIAITFAGTFFLEHLSIIAFKLLPLPDI